MSLPFLPLLDFDGLFASDSDAKPVASADRIAISQNQAREYMRSLFQDGANDLNFIASCECGNPKMTGNFYVGAICPKCKTEVRTNFANELKYRAWLELPDIMPPVLHPRAYAVLENWLPAYQGTSLLQILLNVDATMPPQLSGIMGQGFKYFHDNFDDIMRYFLTQYPPLQNAAGRKKSRWIGMYLNKYYKILFVRHLPILNQSLHLITKSGSMKYSDESSTFILKARIELANAVYSYTNSPIGSSYLDQRMWTMYEAYIGYIDSITNKKLIGKEGFIRKSILGSRCHFSFRCVIVPLNAPHRGDELHLPWRIGVAGLKLEILNLLTNRKGYTMPDAQAKHARAMSNYDPEVDECLKTLIAECPYVGLPVFFGRNPTLRHGVSCSLCSVNCTANLHNCWESLIA